MEFDFDFENAKKVYDELDSIDHRNSMEKLQIAHKLCEKNNVLFSDLVLYEHHIESNKSEVIELPHNYPFFDPLICRIMHIRQDDRYIEFTIPPNHEIDNDEVLLFFNQDVVMSFERGKPGVLRGTIKDKEVFGYIINKLKQL